MRAPEVTIVVTPRERFSHALESLDSIHAHTHEPFHLVYVDGGSPGWLKHKLSDLAGERRFELIRTENYLWPNRARNLGLARVKTPFVVFIDNDVVVTPGWLKQLVSCAKETGAAVVGPLTCQGKPLHQIIHWAGGEASIKSETRNGRMQRIFFERILHQGRKVADMKPKLIRQPTGMTEFHCMLVRTDVLDAVGPLDELLLNTREHLDFCLLVREAGGQVYLEPDSIVTYISEPPLAWSDIPFYMLRWSDEWELASLHRLQTKWNLSKDHRFVNRMKRIGWRRKKTILRPIVQRFPVGKVGRVIEQLLIPADRVINRLITRQYAKHQPKQAA